MREQCWEEDKKFQEFYGYLYTTNNSRMDVEGFIDSPYGEELTKRLKVRFQIEGDVEASREYYASIGLKKENFEWDDYYARWTLLTPLDMDPEKEYPLVFWLHGAGNPIESEETMTGFAQIAAREGFMIAMPQDTTPKKIEAIMEQVAEHYPLDRGRVYLGGFSQGGQMTHASYFRHPEWFAGVITSGDAIFQPWDPFQVNYTPEEIARTKELRVPLMQMCGQCEPFAYSPLNNYVQRWQHPGQPWGSPDTLNDPGKDDNIDPTRIHDLTKGKWDTSFGDSKTARWRSSVKYQPGENDDPRLWSVNRVNVRMELLGCPARDAETCLSYSDLHENELHRITGIYGDYEAVEYHYGYRHYTIGVNDRDGHEMYRYVAVQNSPHWPQLALGEEGWKFLKRFPRDTETGKLIISE